MASKLTSVVIGAKAKHTATVVFLHGLGDSGHGWTFLGDELSSILPHIKWVMPNAPIRPITLNNGYHMPGWFDSISTDKMNTKEQDQKGMLASVSSVNQLIEQEVDDGIPTDRIIVGGFSQGGVISLLTGLTTKYKLAGIIGCSCWLTMADQIKSISSEANKKTPILMCHGEQDTIVSLKLGEDSVNKLGNHGYDVTFKKYAGLAHSANPQEIQDLAIYIKNRLP
ncbi:Phospholipase/carboxylesterase/thioesterase [Chlamydoabsidia padenii]|nr:Phospholipase/carboxylesterase/thioesterase [Chlamydoabsidia padenii]